uniref:Transmembrane protein n=1 Tax=Bracon brevicornis TaxID=1563983 RepID=A0A6V7I9G6_9HYME
MTTAATNHPEVTQHEITLHPIRFSRQTRRGMRCYTHFSPPLFVSKSTSNLTVYLASSSYIVPLSFFSSSSTTSKFEGVIVVAAAAVVVTIPAAVLFSFCVLSTGRVLIRRNLIK